jgi:hypothetical protein
MKTTLRLAASVLVPMILGLVPARAAAPVEPAPQMSTCYSLLIIPCGECPGQRSKYCQPDPTGIFQTCVESLSFCNDTASCHQVTTTTGGPCQ